MLGTHNSGIGNNYPKFAVHNAWGDPITHSLCPFNSEVVDHFVNLSRDIVNLGVFDKILIELDGTAQKKKLGANAILGVSMACCKLAAIENKVPLYKYLSKNNDYLIPIPLLNIINGGVHAKNNLDIQEFMIRPDSANSFSEAMRRSFLVIQNLKTMIHNTNVGDEGGFAPNLKNTEEAIEIIIKAIEKSGFGNVNPGACTHLIEKAIS